VPAGHSPNGDSRTAGKGQLYELITYDTPIFPEGGGQPSDTGLAHFIDANGGRRTFSVEMGLRRGLEAVHLVRVPEGEDVSGLGGEGGEVELEVDWDRRVDHVRCCILLYIPFLSIIPLLPVFSSRLVILVLVFFSPVLLTSLSDLDSPH
jgi:hypothetical protein